MYALSSHEYSSQTYSVSYEKATQFLECGNAISYFWSQWHWDVRKKFWTPKMVHWPKLFWRRGGGGGVVKNKLFREKFFGRHCLSLRPPKNEGLATPLVHHLWRETQGGKLSPIPRQNPVADVSGEFPNVWRSHSHHRNDQWTFPLITKFWSQQV